MIAPQDIRGRAQEIQLLIAEDQVSEALQRLMDFTRDFSDRDNQHDAIVLSSDHKYLEKAARRGEVSFEEAGRQRNKLLYRILDLVDSIEEEPRLRLAS